MISENLIKTMPLCFQSVYGIKVVAIIDCYEVRIEKPLVTKGATWSQYKQANFFLVYHLRVSQPLCQMVGVVE